MRRTPLLCTLGLCFASAVPSIAQSRCSIPEPPFHSNKPNIFSDQQEQWLGDAQAAQTESDYDLLPQKDSSELDRLGQKLLSQLPPTPIRYTFRVYESDDANGFSIAGGYVYISRKLITDARSEDEVAGVLAHEIGHIYTHQVAITVTRQLKAMLHVTSVTTREDVEDKTLLLLNAPWKDRADESEDDAEKDELLADRVGMYALIRAGYAPAAFAANLDRVAANKGHTGNFLTDILGGTSEINLRVRTARKIATSLPPDCSALQPGSSPAFQAFQDAVRSVPIHTLIEPTPGLSSVRLEPPVRTPLSQIRFSPNGAYILAQDESAVHVMSRSPLKRIFSIDAPGALPAQFTPDSSHVVLSYRSMRVESWDVASGKRESFHEMVDYEGCGQISLSPDGTILVCLSHGDQGIRLKMRDVASGKVFYENKAFTLADWPNNVIVRGASGTRVATVLYSQDGNTMLIVSRDRSLAYDLVHRRPISLEHNLTSLAEGRITFVDSNKLVFDCDHDNKSGASTDTFKVCQTGFPDGFSLDEFKVGYQWIEPVTKGNFVLVGPFKDNAAMLVDPSSGKSDTGFKSDTLDIYGNILAIDNESGGIAVGELRSPQMTSIDLPVGPLLNIEAAEFSPDGRFLAYSTRARSTIWDLKTQKRVALMRPFRGVRFDDRDQMYAQYPQSHDRPGQNYHIDLTTGKATAGAPYAIDQFQHGDVLLNFKPQDKTGQTDSNVILQATDPVSGAELWTRRFPHETPMVREREDGTLLLISDLIDQTAQDEIDHPKTKYVKASDVRGEWIAQGLLVQIADSRTGELRSQIQVPQRHANSETKGMVALFGEYLVARGKYNNNTIYRASDGLRLGAFYGRTIAGDGKIGLIAATNHDQEIVIYEAATGKELKRVIVDHLPLAARFVPANNAHLVLTASQAVYSIDLPKTRQPELALSK